MRSAPTITRLWWAALVAIALALRLVTPAGYMPYAEGGRLVIGICEDGAAMAAVPMHGMGDKHSTKHQEPCPYTSVSSFGAAGGEFAPLPILPSAFVAIMPWIARASFESRVAHERPPAIGPPLPA